LVFTSWAVTKYGAVIMMKVNKIKISSLVMG
jgi:hypothetical protein